MTVNEIRAKYWKLCQHWQSVGNVNEQTKRLELELLKAEMLCELAAQSAETNEILKRTIGLVNFEKLCLQLDLAFREAEEIR